MLYRSDQIRSVAQSCPTLGDPMNRSTPGLPVHHQLPELNAIQSIAKNWKQIINLSSQAILWEDIKYRNIKKFNNIISTAINTYNYLVNSRSTTKKSLINHKNKTIRIDP